MEVPSLGSNVSYWVDSAEQSQIALNKYWKMRYIIGAGIAGVTTALLL